MFITIRITRFKINVTLIIQNKRMENRSQKAKTELAKLTLITLYVNIRIKIKLFIKF